MVFIPDPDPTAVLDEAKRLNAELIEVVGGVIAELGGVHAEGGPVYGIESHPPKHPVIMDWYLVDSDQRPLARVCARIAEGVPMLHLVTDAAPTRKVRVRVERYTQGEGEDDGTPSS